MRAPPNCPAKARRLHSFATGARLPQPRPLAEVLWFVERCRRRLLRGDVHATIARHSVRLDADSHIWYELISAAKEYVDASRKRSLGFTRKSLTDMPP